MENDQQPKMIALQDFGQLDPIADMLDDLSALGAHWTRNRERGRMPNGIRLAMITMSSQVHFQVELHQAAMKHPPQLAGLRPHQQRVVDELAEIKERRAKLKAFIETDVFASLHPVERKAMHDQHDAMEAYERSLGDRVHFWLSTTRFDGA